MLERQLLFHQEITNSRTRCEWVQISSQVAKRFGFSHVTLMRVPSREDKLITQLILETTLPTDLVREIDRQCISSNCPIISKIAHTSVPQYWSLEEELPNAPCLQSLKEPFERHGILSGILAPVNWLNGCRYVFRFEGQCPKPDQTVLNELGITAIHAFDVYDRLRKVELLAPKSLTKREIEVVRWTSHGKTSSEIGQILSLSDHTINTYLINAMKKLSCVNRTHLVAKSIRSKLIT